jgi:hypothetical protein
MKLQAIIATLVVVGGVGGAGYLVLRNDVSVEINAPAETVVDEEPNADFRRRIPGYADLSLTEKLREIRIIYDALEGQEKIAAAREREQLGEELNRRAWENVGESDSPGVVPQGWED